MALRSTDNCLYDEDKNGIVSVNTPMPQVGSGPATLIEAGSLDHRNNQKGYTHPDLHRTIDPSDPQHLSEKELRSTAPHEVEPRAYSVGIFNRESYRTTHKIVHTEQEYIRPQGEASRSPNWTEHTDENTEYLAGGHTAIWNEYPPKANPVSRGTPDEIP